MPLYQEKMEKLSLENNNNNTFDASNSWLAKRFRRAMLVLCACSTIFQRLVVQMVLSLGVSFFSAQRVQDDNVETMKKIIDSNLEFPMNQRI